MAGEQKSLAVLLACVALAGCVQTTYGPEQQEPGSVEAKMFVPSGHGTGIGNGFSTSGNVSIVTTSVDIPARYGVVFRCQHGTFAVQGERGSKGFAAWQALPDKANVTIYYREVLEDGKFVDLDFLRAVPR